MFLLWCYKCTYFQSTTVLTEHHQNYYNITNNRERCFFVKRWHNKMKNIYFLIVTKSIKNALMCRVCILTNMKSFTLNSQRSTLMRNYYHYYYYCSSNSSTSRCVFKFSKTARPSSWYMVYVTSKFVEYKKINQFRYKNTDESLIFKYELFVIPSKPVKEYICCNGLFKFQTSNAMMNGGLKIFCTDLIDWLI